MRRAEIVGAGKLKTTFKPSVTDAIASLHCPPLYCQHHVGALLPPLPMMMLFRHHSLLDETSSSAQKT
jgi:hypothetical protein